MNAHSPIVTDEVAHINRALAELMALKSAVQSNDAFAAYSAEYNFAQAVTELFEDDCLQAVKDHAATRLEREFRWDAEENRPSLAEAEHGEYIFHQRRDESMVRQWENGL